MQILIPACHHRLCCSLKYQRDPFFIWHLQWKIRYKAFCMTEIFIGLVFKYNDRGFIFHWHQHYPSSSWHHGEEKFQVFPLYLCTPYRKWNCKNVLSLGISTCRLTYITRKVMIQHRRVVFSPGEELNYLIDKMAAVLNTLSLPQTAVVPPQSYREFGSPDLMKAVFWSGTLPVLAQDSHSPNPWISLHDISSCTSHLHTHRRLAARFEFSAFCLVGFCTCNVRGCHSWATTLVEKRSKTTVLCWLLCILEPSAFSYLQSGAAARQQCQELWGKRSGYCEIAMSSKKTHLILTGNMKHK